MTDKWLLLCTQRGLFVGTDGRYAYFAGIDASGSSRAVLFDSEDDAINYGKKSLNASYEYEYATLAMKTKNKKDLYASVIDIIKAGHGAHTGNMISYLPYANKTVH